MLFMLLFLQWSNSPYHLHWGQRYHYIISVYPKEHLFVVGQFLLQLGFQILTFLFVWKNEIDELSFICISSFIYKVHYV